MMIGMGAGLSPAPRTDNPTYEYLGRMPAEGLVRTHDAAEKLELPVDRMFASTNDPVPVAVSSPVLGPVKVAPAEVIAQQPAPVLPPKQPVVVPDDKILGMERNTFYMVAGGAGAVLLLMRGRGKR